MSFYIQFSSYLHVFQGPFSNFLCLLKKYRAKRIYKCFNYLDYHQTVAVSKVQIKLSVLYQTKNRDYFFRVCNVKSRIRS